MRQTIFAVLSLFVVTALLSGCGGDFVLINSKGDIGIQQRDLIFIAFGLMLLVVIPAIAMALWYAYKYRESNKDAEYLPNWSHSTKIEIFVWGVPILIICALAYLAYVKSHSLDPYKPIESDNAEVRIQVIAEPFKWVFIYPEQNIATVNEIYVPVNHPVKFELTSDFSMNSFFIPQLGGQVYAMAGMKTQLHLIAREQGIFDGISSNYSGYGFTRMKFKAHAVSDEQYAAWIDKVKQSNSTLDFQGFKAMQEKVSQDSVGKHHELIKPEPDPVVYFSNVQADLFKAVLNQYMMVDHKDHATDEHATVEHENASAGGN